MDFKRSDAHPFRGVVGARAAGRERVGWALRRVPCTANGIARNELPVYFD
jgi:hypothetical protein